jgi:hypothetical protein
MKVLVTIHLQLFMIACLMLLQFKKVSFNKYKDLLKDKFDYFFFLAKSDRVLYSGAVSFAILFLNLLLDSSNVY